MTRRSPLPLLLAGVAALAACSGEPGADAAQPKAREAVRAAAGGTPAANPAPGQPTEFPAAPPFTLSAVTGGSLSLAELSGKVVLIDFWATWCGPCRAGIPHLNEMYTEHKDSGLEIVGISLDGERGGRSGLEIVRDYTSKQPIAYKLVMGDAGVVNAYGGIRSIPTAFLVDRAGKIRKRYVGLQPREVFERDIAALLAESAPESDESM